MKSNLIILLLGVLFGCVSCAANDIKNKTTVGPKIIYPYFASAERQLVISNGYLLIEIGMSIKQVNNVLGDPDEVNPTYDVKKRPSKIGYSHVYLLSRERLNGSVNEKNEHLVRVMFNLDDKVVRVDKW